MADNVVFSPVRGTQAAIDNMTEIRDGWVYFAYDTGNIYIDKAGARFPMGNSSAGIIYAHGEEDEIIKIDPDDETSFDYSIPTSVLDSQVVPKPDSLILNSDGRFFRTITVENNTVIAQLLAVSGTGGGGGSIVTYSDRAKIKPKTPESQYLINGKSAIISIYGVSGKDVDGSILDETLNFKWTLSEKDTTTGVLTQYAQGGDTFPATIDESNP